MDQTQTRQEMMQMVTSTRQALHELAAGLDPTEHDRTGTLADWSAKDIFPHITFWNRNLLKSLDCALHGRTPQKIADFDATNDRTQAEFSLQPWAEALADLDNVYDQVVEKTETFATDLLFEANRFEWNRNRSLASLITGNAIWHPIWHITEYQIKHGNRIAAVSRYAAFTDRLVQLPGWDINGQYNLACIYARVGDQASAIPPLKKAIELRPDLLDLAKGDSDLDGLRGYPEFEALLHPE